jgi:RHS repeat-associated protein
VGSATLTALANASNQLVSTVDPTSGVQRTLSYNPGGDLAQDVHAGGVAYGYGYNAAKRLVAVNQNGASAGAYAYDFNGQRVWRQTFGGGAAQTAYVYDEDGHLLAEQNAATGAVNREYVWIDDMPVALLDISGSTVTTNFIHTGQIDEPLAVTNSSQALVWNAYIDPYGTANFIGTPTEALDMRLPGQSVQAETEGLSQNGWRDYDPSLGRYVEADPLGIDAGQNVYAYVDGDPLNFIDPMGLAGIPFAPPPNLPGGPYTPAGPGQQPGTFLGPRQPSGPRSICRWVPPEGEGGPPGSQGYWKTQAPQQSGWSRFSQAGEPISPGEAHPGPGPGQIIWSSTEGGPIVAGIVTFLTTLFWATPAH